VGVAVYVAGTEDEASPQLEGVFAEPVLAVTGGARPLPGRHVVAAEEMEQRGIAETDRAIRLPPLVNQQREGDAGVLAEQAGVVQVAKSDGGKSRPSFPDCLLVFAQLRDVLPAEHSAVVAEEDEDRGGVGPKGAESNLASFGVG
jgi:hypothetical protein